MAENFISVTLDKYAALVLFEWLATLESTGAAPPRDSAEQKVLWRIEGQLEKLLSEPFAANYTELLEQARKRVLSEP